MKIRKFNESNQVTYTPAKVFNTGDMTEEMFSVLHTAGIISRDSIGEYEIGWMANEQRNHQSEEERDDHKLGYQKEIDEFTEIDTYMISAGAIMGEKVLIYHGTF